MIFDYYFVLFSQFHLNGLEKVCQTAETERFAWGAQYCVYLSGNKEGVYVENLKNSNFCFLMHFFGCAGWYCLNPRANVARRWGLVGGVFGVGGGGSNDLVVI